MTGIHPHAHTRAASISHHVVVAKEPHPCHMVICHTSAWRAICISSSALFVLRDVHVAGYLRGPAGKQL